MSWWQQIIDLINHVLSGGADAQETLALLILLLVVILGGALTWFILRPLIRRGEPTVAIKGDEVIRLLQMLEAAMTLFNEQGSMFKRANDNLDARLEAQQKLEEARLEVRKADLDMRNTHLASIDETQKRYLAEVLPVAQVNQEEHRSILQAIRDLEERLVKLWENKEV